MNPVVTLRDLMKGATPVPLTLIRYEHGGGRLYREEPRTLVADFFDEGDRELFAAMRNALPALLTIADTMRDIAGDSRRFPLLSDEQI